MRIANFFTPSPKPAPPPGTLPAGGANPSVGAPTAPLTAPRPAGPATTPLGTDALSLTGQAPGSSSLSDVVAKAREAAAKRPEWTMAVNLAASLNEDFGATSKAQQLKDLAKETEGKPVTIVAQQVKGGENGPVVERFVIKDGKVASMGESRSEGFAKDLENLTAMASKDHPANRMGVIIQSHGNAIDGMKGDNGEAGLSEIRDALRTGMDRGGRGKLDMLDFDACLMGQQEVLSAMKGVADHVVASSEVELASSGLLGGKVDGQPTVEMMRALLANPEMDGDAFAKKTVELAATNEKPADYDNDGVADPDSKPFNATPTLTAYDMQHLNAMSDAVDGLGSALADAMKNPKNRKAIQALISLSPRFSPGDEGAGMGKQQRDLKHFAQALQGAIAQGTLKDPSGKIAQAAEASLKAIDDLVDAHHGEKERALPRNQPLNYNEMGGVGIFMPSTEFLGGTAETLSTPLEQIVTNAEYFAKQVTDPSMTAEGVDNAKSFFMGGAQGAMAKIWIGLPADKKQEFTPLRDAFFALDQATTPADIAKAAKHYGEVADRMQKSPLGEHFKSRLRDERRQLVEEAYSLAAPHMSEGWSRFTQALRGGN